MRPELMDTSSWDFSPTDAMVQKVHRHLVEVVKMRGGKPARQAVRADHVLALVQTGLEEKDAMGFVAEVESAYARMASLPTI